MKKTPFLYGSIVQWFQAIGTISRTFTFSTPDFDVLHLHYVVYNKLRQAITRQGLKEQARKKGVHYVTAKIGA